MSISAMKQALEALENTYAYLPRRWGGEVEADQAITALRQAIAEAEKQEPGRMRMPKVGDRVICLEDETLGTVKYLTAGGSPEINFDDGSYGTYLLREFAELFGYAAPVHASDISQERVDETAKDRHEWNEIQCPCGHKMYAKYTKREWVGLEEEEILKCFDSVSLGQVEGDCVIDKHVNIFNAIRAIESKLKEKNT